ncbi:MAG: cell division FtsA domain-containing protein [bacterium]
MVNEELTFSLDIGTRKIAGLVGRRQAGKIHIVAAKVIEHETRTMLDGQIHDVERVSQEVKLVKETLEGQIGEPLRRVAVAAAGRALKTSRAIATIEVPHRQEITYEMVSALEFSAIQQALRQLEVEQQRSREGGQPSGLSFHCVGWTVVHYRLDDAVIGNLVGQRGKVASAEIIATFLPRVVVDSLYAVLRRCGLEVSSLTLEPIAALNVIIPRDIRMLNLVLLDIGAGTTDMAFTKDGTVVAYAMVPIAGDEITEKICREYLLDFSVGERLKRSLLTTDKLHFEDILGVEYEISSKELIDKLEDTIRDYVDRICDVIIEINTSSPDAVMCVGGGSQIPLLAPMIAERLKIPRNRVAVRGAEAIQHIIDDTGTLKGPEFVTPYGILYSAYDTRGYKFMNVEVNDNPVRLMKIKDEVTILDALVAGGIPPEKIHGGPGSAITVEVNGKLKIIRGADRPSSIIRLNGKEADLGTIIKDGDLISIDEPEDWNEIFAVTLDQVVDSLPGATLSVNGEQVSVTPSVFVNGQIASMDMIITDGAKIEWNSDILVRDALLASGVDMTDLDEREMEITVNGQDRYFLLNNYRVSVNGEPADLGTVVHNEDSIEFVKQDELSYSIMDILDIPQGTNSITVTVNGETIRLEGEGTKIYMNGEEVSPDAPIVNGANITIERGEDKPFILSNIFKYYKSLDLGNAGGKKLEIFVNGRRAGFTTPLNDGDSVEIGFV